MTYTKTLISHPLFLSDTTLPTPDHPKTTTHSSSATVYNHSSPSALPDWHDHSLEEKLQHVFVDISISAEEKDTISHLLTPLRDKNEATHFHYQHSVRVGLLCYDIAEFMHLDKKPLFYGGLLHDLGKSCMPLELLAKADVRLSENIDWTTKDREKMKAHVTKSYQLVKAAEYPEISEIIPDIVVRHHRYGRDPYPKKLPKFPAQYSEGTKTMIGFYSRIVALADVYDALHRLDQQQRSKEEIKRS